MKYWVTKEIIGCSCVPALCKHYGSLFSIAWEVSTLLSDFLPIWQTVITNVGFISAFAVITSFLWLGSHGIRLKVQKSAFIKSHSYVQALFWPCVFLCRHCRDAILMTISFWVVSAFNQLCSSRIQDPAVIFLFLSPPHSSHSLSDLDHFKVHTRSAVSVREGQGVVLLCGTPTSSGGDLSLILQ